MSLASRLLLWVLGASLFTGCYSAVHDDGLVKYKVAGIITINGKPLERVIVRFQHTDPTVQGAAASPVGHTDAEGNFAMSTSGDGDGVVAGEYIVTFLRASDDYTSGKDLFRNRFIDPGKSEHRVTVSDEDLVMPPIDLEVPAQWLTAPPRADD
ncbi:hypothetical protein [Blastopirellula marina]|uniref:Carboxypeptidase regulatory-like domain-containing protein n=1 Tax=Blastopirellula marina TaxID=124 RepID=A0A2S8F9U1_9BACT|nr:hypothetical protein [Blastopirellula marina]PQO28714.1 hypothetical protein C5Y98_23305 [Blastopirellula marina]PTL41987.1 hypothetical protein C5Y97_23315 [Blastopirellula marina]